MAINVNLVRDRKAKKAYQDAKDALLVDLMMVLRKHRDYPLDQEQILDIGFLDPDFVKAAFAN